MSQFDRDKWDAKYAAHDTAPREPSALLASFAEYLPTRGRALDIAGGAGRNAIWLARRGLDVTIADISSVGLSLAQRRAADAGVTLNVLQIDLQEQPLLAGPFDLIVSVCYLWRPLSTEFSRLLADGGTLIVVQPTLRNLERNEKPPAAFLLNEGELRQMAHGLEVVHSEEGWLADGRHDAVLIARKR